MRTIPVITLFFVYISSAYPMEKAEIKEFDLPPNPNKNKTISNWDLGAISLKDISRAKLGNRYFDTVAENLIRAALRSRRHHEKYCVVPREYKVREAVEVIKHLAQEQFCFRNVIMYSDDGMPMPLLIYVIGEYIELDSLARRKLERNPKEQVMTNASKEFLKELILAGADFNQMVLRGSLRCYNHFFIRPYVGALPALIEYTNIKDPKVKPINFNIKNYNSGKEETIFSLYDGQYRGTYGWVLKLLREAQAKQLKEILNAIAQNKMGLIKYFREVITSDLRDEQGNTMLHIALMQPSPNLDLIKLVYACDPSMIAATNNAGKTALELAIGRGGKCTEFFRSVIMRFSPRFDFLRNKCVIS